MLCLHTLCDLLVSGMTLSFLYITFSRISTSFWYTMSYETLTHSSWNCIKNVIDCPHNCNNFSNKFWPRIFRATLEENHCTSFAYRPTLRYVSWWQRHKKTLFTVWTTRDWNLYRRWSIFLSRKICIFWPFFNSTERRQAIAMLSSCLLLHLVITVIKVVLYPHCIFWNGAKLIGVSKEFLGSSVGAIQVTCILVYIHLYIYIYICVRVCACVRACRYLSYDLLAI